MKKSLNFDIYMGMGLLFVLFCPDTVVIYLGKYQTIIFFDFF